MCGHHQDMDWMMWQKLFSTFSWLSSIERTLLLLSLLLLFEPSFVSGSFSRLIWYFKCRDGGDGALFWLGLLNTHRHSQSRRYREMENPILMPANEAFKCLMMDSSYMCGYRAQSYVSVSRDWKIKIRNKKLNWKWRCDFLTHTHTHTRLRTYSFNEWKVTIARTGSLCDEDNRHRL